VIFDEVQACQNALTSLKYFCEELPEFHVAAAGSLLGLHLGEGSFPVGRVDMMTLYPLSFEEFLTALEGPERVDYFGKISWDSPPSEAVHDYLLWRLNHYFVVGGMPDAVRAFKEHQDDLFVAFQRVESAKITLFWPISPIWQSTLAKRMLCT
jgi:uncharacterized protein